MGAAAFNDINPGDYNYTDFSGGPMRRPRNMMPGNLSRSQNICMQNGFIFTLILHQIIMYFDKVMLPAGKITIALSTPFIPIPPLQLDELTDQ